MIARSRALLLPVALFALSGQVADPVALDLDSIFAGDAFAADRFGPARWLDAGAYATVESSPTVEGGDDLVRYDAATGARSVVVAAEQLMTGVARRSPLSIEDYAFSPDGDLLLVYSNSQRVWRTRSRGDYWLLDRSSGSLRQIGGNPAESALSFAKFSPDGNRVAFVMANDLHMQDLRTDIVTRLTHDGTDTVVNGTFDWVYEEELGLHDGFRWSPDGRHLAFWQIDGSLVEEFVLINNTEQLYPVLKRFPYPKAGETNPAARVGVIPAGGGEVTWVTLAGSPRDRYIARMEWAGPGELALQVLNRRQNMNRLYLADIRNGRAREIVRETDAAWVEIRNDLHWLDGGRAFTWVSERDGWRRAYRVDRSGVTAAPLTPPGRDLLALDHVDEAGGWLYYTASPDPTRRFLYRVPLEPEPEAATAISPLDGGGTHRYDIAPGARWAIRSWSRYDDPPRTDVVSFPDHAVVREIVGNDRLRAAFTALERPATEFFRVGIEPGVALDAWAMFPRDFDPTKRYPVLFNVYGEPAGQTVLDRWPGAGGLWHHYLTELGYLVMSVDNRGTPAPRGRDWRKVVYGEVGTLAAADQAAAVAAILRERPYVDPERVGIWGWSGGGSMTLNALFRYPDTYALGMSVAPVPDQRYYDTIYQERYMGTPQDNPDGYWRASPISHAGGLRGKLLLVHGTGDDNVHYQGTEALINELVRRGKQFSMMAYPNRTHGISEGEGTTRHLYGLLTRFLTENLAAGAR